MQVDYKGRYVRYDSLESGRVFFYNGRVYISLDETRDDTGFVMCADLETGEIEAMSGGAYVQPAPRARLVFD